LAGNSTDGLIVFQNGLLVRAYFRFGFDIDDIHLIHSSGKCFTSFATQPVYDRIGREGLDRPLSEYLPRLRGKFFGEATLAQALDMQVGMEWSENYEDPTTATMLSGPVGGWDPVDPVRGPESWFQRMFDFPKYGEHGETWVYSSASVIAAALAAAAIVDRPFGDLVQASYEKLGFEDRSWYVCNRLGELSAEGGQALTIRDHAKLGRFMLEEKGSAYVSDVWNMTADENDPADAVFLKKYPFAKAYKNYWYKLDDDIIIAIGSSGQFLYVDRSKNLIISKFSSFVEGQGKGEFAEALGILGDIAELY
jgi:CubicO group peptidase (beta-lactamase class C family)